MEHIATRWISGRATIGIVLWKSSGTGKLRATIAVVAGEDQNLDTKYVMEWGNRLSYQEAKGFFPDILKNKKVYMGYK